MKNIFQLIKAGIVLTAAAVAFAACSEEKMDEINTDYGNAPDAPGKYVITDMELRTAQNVVGGDFNTYLGSYVEYWTGTHNQLYKAEKREAEVKVSSTFNNGWGTIYENIRNGKVVIEKCSEGGSDPFNVMARAIGKTMLAFNAAFATDMYGDTPYTEVGDAYKFPFPKADKQADIYKTVFELLESAAADFESANGTDVGGNDLIYHGKVANWVKFINGLKARYLLQTINRSSNKNADYQKIIDCVDASFASADEQASIQYDGNNQNPVFDFEWSRDGISSSSSMNARLAARHDPRADRVYWHPSSWGHFTSEKAAPYLAPTGDPEESQYQYMYDVYFFAEVAPIHFLSYFELQFIKAEAQARLGKNVEAKETLKTAVEAAFANFNESVAGALDSPTVNGYGGLEPLGVEDFTDADADAYFDAEVAPLFDANPIKEILMQKYIAQWNANGGSVWTYNDIRRAKANGEGDFYGLVNPGQFPVRLPYGADDVIANPNIKELYGNDGGNYVFTENVWWAGGSR